MYDVSPVSFMVDVIGDVTGHKWEGNFQAKPVLTHSEQLLRDQIMRDLLGVNPKDASPRAVSQSGIIAEIRVRCTVTPSWWKDANNGLSLYDENILAVIFDKCLEIDQKWKDDIRIRAEKAKKDLAEAATK